MSDRRLELHEKLCDILGSRNVYFSPPESVRLQYPCIVYSRSNGETTFADDWPYTFSRRYECILIDPNPDSGFIEQIAMSFQKCTFSRHYISDNLNHDAFNIYY